MSTYDDIDARGDFAALIQRHLQSTSFVPPAANEACAAVFDLAPWLSQRASAEIFLEPWERERAARFHFDRDRDIYILAHAIWRLVLCRCLARSPDSVPLESLPSGQPHLPGTGWSTSLSHSGTWVAVAMAQAVTVGVDIEQFPSRADLSALTATICTPAEAADIENMPASDRDLSLLRLWTRKEALLKGFGIGLLQPPATFSASTDDVMPPPAASSYPPMRWRDLCLLPSIVGAIAVTV
jgi:4'-phosphopantetheinyl transferase